MSTSYHATRIVKVVGDENFEAPYCAQVFSSREEAEAFVAGIGLVDSLHVAEVVELDVDLLELLRAVISLVDYCRVQGDWENWTGERIEDFVLIQLASAVGLKPTSPD